METLGRGQSELGARIVPLLLGGVHELGCLDEALVRTLHAAVGLLGSPKPFLARLEACAPCRIVGGGCGLGAGALALLRVLGALDGQADQPDACRGHHPEEASAVFGRAGRRGPAGGGRRGLAEGGGLSRDAVRIRPESCVLEGGGGSNDRLCASHSLGRERGRATERYRGRHDGCDA